MANNEMPEVVDVDSGQSSDEPLGLRHETDEGTGGQMFETELEVPRRRISRIARAVRNTLGAFSIVAAVLAATYGLSRKDLNEIQMEHDGFEFTLETMTLREKISQLVLGSSYDSRTGYAFDNAISKLPLPADFTDWLTDSAKSDELVGGVHIFNSDARTPEEAHRTIVEIMSKSKIPPFISMDIVGGYTRHLGITREHSAQYGVPDRFLAMAARKNLALPTQEDIGREFISLETVKERVEFRKELEDYGVAVATMCSEIGISINFAPVLDLVDDFDGNNFMEYNDQSYGESAYAVQILGFHFLKGFQSVGGVIASPKHFFGTGKSPNDPHEYGDQEVTLTDVKDGTVLPFKDAITGRLFYDAITMGYKLDVDSFDFKLRKVLRRIRNAKRINRKKALSRARSSYRRLLAEYELTTEDVPEDFMDMPRVSGMMVSHSQNFTNPNVPGTVSSEMVERRLQHNLGFKGIVVSDDLNMGATQNYVETEIDCKDGWPAEVFARSVAAGVDMPMLLHHSGEIDTILDRVRIAIASKEDFDGDGKPDITVERINRSVRKILEQKVKIGLLKAQRNKQGIVYINNSQNFLSQRKQRF